MLTSVSSDNVTKILAVSRSFEICYLVGSVFIFYICILRLKAIACFGTRSDLLKSGTSANINPPPRSPEVQSKQGKERQRKGRRERG